MNRFPLLLALSFGLLSSPSAGAVNASGGSSARTFLFAPVTQPVGLALSRFLATPGGRALIQADGFWGEIKTLYEADEEAGRAAMAPLLAAMPPESRDRFASLMDNFEFHFRVTKTFEQDPTFRFSEKMRKEYALFLEALLLSRHKAVELANKRLDAMPDSLTSIAQWQESIAQLETVKPYNPPRVSRRIEKARAVIAELRTLKVQGALEAGAQTLDSESLAGIEDMGRKAARTAEWALDGSPQSQQELAKMYELGWGGVVSRDLAKAAHWYEKAAKPSGLKAGSREAQYHLATMHEEGRGVAQDLKRAYFYYSLAFNQGIEIASTKMLELAKRMSQADLIAVQLEVRRLGASSQVKDEAPPAPRDSAVPSLIKELSGHVEARRDSRQAPLRSIAIVGLLGNLSLGAIKLVYLDWNPLPALLIFNAYFLGPFLAGFSLSYIFWYRKNERRIAEILRSFMPRQFGGPHGPKAPWP